MKFPRKDRDQAGVGTMGMRCQRVAEPPCVTLQRCERFNDTVADEKSENGEDEHQSEAEHPPLSTGGNRWEHTFHPALAG